MSLGSLFIGPSGMPSHFLISLLRIRKRLAGSGHTYGNERRKDLFVSSSLLGAFCCWCLLLGHALAKTFTASRFVSLRTSGTWQGQFTTRHFAHACIGYLLNANLETRDEKPFPCKAELKDRTRKAAKIKLLSLANVFSHCCSGLSGQFF